MGCGKSSVGRKLSELLCCPFMDLDSVIEERAGCSIPEIFANDGEAVFRQMELDTLRTIINSSTTAEGVQKQSLPSSMGPSLCGQRGSTVSAPSLLPHHCMVLALGGGAVMTPECAELVREKTLCIYLRTSVDTLVSRLASEAEGRPLLNPASQPESTDSSNSPNEPAADLRTRIESLMSRRASTYEATAHMILDTDGLSIDEIVQTLATKIRTIR